MKNKNNVNYGMNLKYLSSILYLILMISIYLMIFVNSTILYNKSIMFMILFSVLMLFLFKKVHFYRFDSIKFSWLFVGIFSVFNVLYSKDFYSSLYWVIFLLIIILLIEVDLELSFFEALFSKVELITFFFALTIILNVFVKNLMTNYLILLVKKGSYNYLNIEVSQGIYSGILAEKGSAAVAMVIGLGMTFSKILVHKKIHFKQILLVCIYFIAIFFTGKRSLTFIPIMSFIVCFLVCKEKGKYKKIISLSLVFTIFLYIALKFIPQTRIIIERILLLIDDGGINTNGRSTVLWPICFRMYNLNKLFGVGLNTFNGYFSDYGIWGSWNAHAHNTYIQLLGETGIIGTGIYCTSFIISLIKTISLIREKNSLIEEKDKILIVYSLYIQLFWLIYGISGNPLYYHGQLLLYAMCITMVKTFNRFYKRKKLIK